MSVCESAAIIGLGLVGGSIARDLAARGVRISGFDAHDGHLAKALTEGIVHTALDASLVGVNDVDLIVIAVPVDEAVDVLQRIARYEIRARLITDVGSTKARIVTTASSVGLGSRFIGAHPMAGGHRSGWEASSSGLFDGARVYLCPAADATGNALQLARALWETLGARPTCIDAVEHDRTLAWTSHLPHVASTAVALALSRAGFGRHDLGPGGRDITRLAGSSPAMWTAIARENAKEIDAALAAAEDEIAAFRRARATHDAHEIRERFTSAREWFER
jgi:prephenate dehydrogenase